MSNFYFDADADLGLLKDKTVAILGYGNQGRSQALNPTIMQVGAILTLTMAGKIEASAIRSPRTPSTRRSGPTTRLRSPLEPRRQVPAG